MISARANTAKTNSLDRGYWVFLLPGLVMFLLVIILPFLVTIGASFTKWNGVTTPKFIGIDNYANALNDAAFWASFTNNLKLMLAMVVIPTILGLLLAGLLSISWLRVSGTAGQACSEPGSTCRRLCRWRSPESCGAGSCNHPAP